MSDVERLTAINQERMRFAAQVARDVDAKKRVEQSKRKAAAKRDLVKRWKKMGTVVCNMAAGWFCGLLGYCLAVGIMGAAAPVLYLLTVMSVIGGIALDEDIKW